MPLTLSYLLCNLKYCWFLTQAAQAQAAPLVSQKEKRNKFLHNLQYWEEREYIERPLSLNEWINLQFSDLEK
jgi:hypothetical protein